MQAGASQLKTRRVNRKGAAFCAAKTTSIRVLSTMFKSLVGLLYSAPYAIVMECIVDEGCRTTAWKIHTSTGFSFSDTVSICTTLSEAGYITAVFDPSGYCACAISVYECAAAVLLVDTTVPAKRKTASISTTETLTAWISAHSSIEIKRL